MDMNILLALQDFRNGAGSFLTDFFVKMTFLGELNTVIVIMALIYWSVSKKLGTYLLMGWSAAWWAFPPRLPFPRKSPAHLSGFWAIMR